MKFRHYTIVKSNKLVQSRSTFSALEHRIILLALVQIKPTDLNLKMYRISIQDVLGKEHTSHYDLVRNSVENLHRSTIRIEEEDGWRSYPFIIKAQGKYGKSYIEIQFHEDIQHFLLGLKSQYTTYTLHNVINFKRNYSLRIYELCKQYQRIGFREISISQLRTLFLLEHKYALYSNFKKTVLKNAIEEINKYSDLFLKYEEKKSGKKVERIKFIIRNNKAISGIHDTKTLAEIDFEESVARRLYHAGFEEKEITKLREKYTEERVNEVLELCDLQINHSQIPKVCIFNALEDDRKTYKEFREKEFQQIREYEEKNKIIDQKKREILALEDKIETDRNDIRAFEKTQKLRASDMICFKDKTVQESIKYLEDRVDTNEYILEKRKRDFKNILDSAPGNL